MYVGLEELEMSFSILNHFERKLFMLKELAEYGLTYTYVETDEPYPTHDYKHGTTLRTRKQIRIWKETLTRIYARRKRVGYKSTKEEQKFLNDYKEWELSFQTPNKHAFKSQDMFQLITFIRIFKNMSEGDLCKLIGKPARYFHNKERCGFKFDQEECKAMLNALCGETWKVECIVSE